MPDADTVWLTPLPTVRALLALAGLRVRRLDDVSHAHAATADALGRAFAADRPAITARIGAHATAELVAAHRLWSAWLRAGRVRKFAIVAEKAQRPT